jgi:hypothetical protein
MKNRQEYGLSWLVGLEETLQFAIASSYEIDVTQQGYEDLIRDFFPPPALLGLMEWENGGPVHRLHSRSG